MPVHTLIPLVIWLHESLDPSSLDSKGSSWFREQKGFDDSHQTGYAHLHCEVSGEIPRNDAGTLKELKQSLPKV